MQMCEQKGEIGRGRERQTEARGTDFGSVLLVQSGHIFQLLSEGFDFFHFSQLRFGRFIRSAHSTVQHSTAQHSTAHSTLQPPNTKEREQKKAAHTY
jgi:hypothetical protein